MPVTGEVIPCHSESYGWWSAGDGCYYTLTDPQPEPDSLNWDGKYPNGAIYDAWCAVPGGDPGSPFVLSLVWFAAAPPGGPPTPAQLAAQAIDSMTLLGPSIQMAPRPGSVGLVGLPVWMWVGVDPTHWGPTSATAAVPGLSVTATARAARVVWSMGDGTSVTCQGPGTPYSPARGGSMSPTCGHRYEHSSAAQPGRAYAVTATSTWIVQWVGGGRSGTITLTRSTATQVRIGELQVLIR